MSRKGRSKKSIEVELASDDSIVNEDSIAVSLPHGPLDPGKDSEKSKHHKDGKKEREQKSVNYSPQSMVTYFHNLIQHQKNINNVTATLQSEWSQAKQLEDDKQRLLGLKICCIVFLIVNFLFVVRDTLGGMYNREQWYLPYWIAWIVMASIMIISHIKEKPHLVRIVIHIIIWANILPWFNFRCHRKFTNLGMIIQYNQTQNIGLLGAIVLMCVNEHAIFWVPVSFIYQFAMCFGQQALFYEKSGVKNQYSFVLQNKVYDMLPVLILQGIIVQYTAVLSVKYFRNLQQEAITQLSVAKISLKKVVSHLNVALILRNQDGQISFCNDLGANLVRNVSRDIFKGQKSLNKFMAKISSMDFLSSHLFNMKESETATKQNKWIMNAPMMKLYTKRSSDGQMDQGNLALSPEEQQNLQRNGQKHTQDMYFSLADLFNSEQQDFEDNVYEVLDDVQMSKTEFKYVQVRKEYVETSFSKHEVLQLIDISQKILYEAAVGEKRLFSIINASVSHDMRNPTNSIQMQVQEQQTLNQKLKNTIDTLSPTTVKKSKKNLEGVLTRLEESTNIQVSSCEILKFFLNDMLDYAQMSAGQFRKFFKSFDLVESVEEILSILRFKADELGIDLEMDFANFKDSNNEQSDQINSSSSAQKCVVFFDQQRLQQVLLNLVANGIKFTQSGGKISVSAKLIDTEHDLTVKDESLESIMRDAVDNDIQYLEVQVKDTGIGIKDEDKPKLFHLFGFLQSGESINPKGIGLGLNITKRITKLFDGDIICRSKQGQGTTFTFIVALGKKSNEVTHDIGSQRILNPVKKFYEKIDLTTKGSAVGGGNTEDGDINFGQQLAIIQEENAASKNVCKFASGDSSDESDSTDRNGSNDKSNTPKDQQDSQDHSTKKLLDSDPFDFDQLSVKDEDGVQRAHGCPRGKTFGTKKSEESDSEESSGSSDRNGDQNDEESGDQTARVQEQKEKKVEVKPSGNNQAEVKEDQAQTKIKSQISSETKKKSIVRPNDVSSSQMPKRILIVDDEPYNVMGMQLQLSRLGIKGLASIIDRAYDGIESLKKVKDSYTNGTHTYGLILTDISMPIMDGFESSEKIRNFYRANKVAQPMIVACTGHAEEQYIQKAWCHEIDEVIPKPVSPDILKLVFAEMLETDQPAAE